MTHSDLTAFVHGELDARRTRELQQQIAADPALRAHVDALRAADQALLDTLDTHAAPQRARTSAAWWRPLVAIAALFVIAAVFLMTRNDPAFAQNDLVSLRASVHGGASQPIFTDVALDLQWRKRADGFHWFAVRPYGFGDTLEAIGRKEAASIETAGKIVPLAISAILHAPDGTRIPARLDAAPEPFRETAEQRVLLRDFVIQTAEPPPYLGGRPGDRCWIEDFAWGFQAMPGDGPRRWLLDQPGEWTVELRVECGQPPEAGLWPTFAEPLVAAVKIVATGEASPWGAAHDGLQARLLLATGCADPDRAPLALQLRNTGDRTRRYNVIGMTMATIPQPLHCQLFVSPTAAQIGNGEGDAWSGCDQRKDLRVVIPHDSLMVPHPAGTVRTIVLCPDYWRSGGGKLGDLGERHLMAVFHFEASVWLATDTELWQGKITTGHVTLPARGGR